MVFKLGLKLGLEDAGVQELISNIRTWLRSIYILLLEHRISPSSKEKAKGVMDTLLGWFITSLYFSLHKFTDDIFQFSFGLCVLFGSGMFVIVLYTALIGLASNTGLNPIRELAISEYNETDRDHEHLCLKRRRKLIFWRSFLSIASFASLTWVGDVKGVINNSDVIGAEGLAFSILQYWIFKKKSFRKLTGCIVLIIGVSAYFLVDVKSGISSNLWAGGISLLSAISFSLQFFITSVSVRHDPPLRIAFHQLKVGFIFSLIFLALVLSYKHNSRETISFGEISIIKDSIIIGILYAVSLFFFLRAFLHTEPIIIAMLGYSLSFFNFGIGWFLNGITWKLSEVIRPGIIALGGGILIYDEYHEKHTSLGKKPVYHNSPKKDFIELRKYFSLGRITRNVYIREIFEYHKLLGHYSFEIRHTSIEKIELGQGKVIFHLRRPRGLSFETDLKCDSPVFERINFEKFEGIFDLKFDNLIQDGSIIIDLDAHLGWESLNIAKRLTKSKLICFEHERRAFEILTNNIRNNQLSNIIAVHVVVSESSTMLLQENNEIVPCSSGIKFKEYIKKLYNGTVDMIMVDPSRTSIKSLDFLSELLKSDKPKIYIKKICVTESDIHLFFNYFINLGYQKKSEQIGFIYLS